MVDLYLPTSQEGTLLRWNPIFPIQTAIEPTDELLLGDINFDGIVDILDLVGYVSVIVGATEFNEAQLAVSDMNGDGILDVLDIVAIVLTILEE